MIPVSYCAVVVLVWLCCVTYSYYAEEKATGACLRQVIATKDETLQVQDARIVVLHEQLRLTEQALGTAQAKLHHYEHFTYGAYRAVSTDN